MEVSGQHHVPLALPPWNNHGIHWIGGWVGPTAGLGFGRRDDDDNNNNVIGICVYVLLLTISQPPPCSACSYYITLYIFGVTVLHSQNSVPPCCTVPFIAGYFSDIRCVGVWCIHVLIHSVYTTHRHVWFQNLLHTKTEIHNFGHNIKF